MCFSYKTKFLFKSLINIIVNYLRKYTYGAHFTNGKCLFITLILISIFSYLVKTIPMEWSFLVMLWCIRDIYIKSPLKLTVKNKDLEWHKNRIMLILAILLLASVIGLYFNLYIITNSILYSIIMVDLTLFVNEKL